MDEHIFMLASVVPRLGRCHVTEPLCNIFVPKKPNTVFFLKGFSAFNFEPSAAPGFIRATRNGCGCNIASCSTPERRRLSFSCLHELEGSIFMGHYIRYT